MGYGRNFDFRIPPHQGDRLGRFVLTGTAGGHVVIGAPVTYDSVTAAPTDFPGAENVKLATGAQAPIVGQSGILVYEWGPAAFAGDDPFLTTYSDKDFAPVGKLVQVVHGSQIKVLLKNTSARTFLNTRAYAGRVMVAGLAGATPTVAVGDMLTPGTGNDTAGYWVETATASQAWLRVVAVDNTRSELEAQLLF